MYLGTKLLSDVVMCNKLTTSGLKVKFFTQIQAHWKKLIIIFALSISAWSSLLRIILYNECGYCTYNAKEKARHRCLWNSVTVSDVARSREGGEGWGEVERGRFIILTPSSPRQIIIANNDSPRLPNPLPSQPSSITLIAPI